MNESIPEGITSSEALTYFKRCPQIDPRVVFASVKT